jgi:hypothetical protein
MSKYTIDEQKVISFSTPMIESSDSDIEEEEQLRLGEQLLRTLFKLMMFS